MRDVKIEMGLELGLTGSEEFLQGLKPLFGVLVMSELKLRPPIGDAGLGEMREKNRSLATRSERAVAVLPWFPFGAQGKQGTPDDKHGLIGLTITKFRAGKKNSRLNGGCTSLRGSLRLKGYY